MSNYTDSPHPQRSCSYSHEGEPEGYQNHPLAERSVEGDDMEDTYAKLCDLMGEVRGGRLDDLQIAILQSLSRKRPAEKERRRERKTRSSVTIREKSTAQVSSPEMSRDRNTLARSISIKRLITDLETLETRYENTDHSYFNANATLQQSYPIQFAKFIQDACHSVNHVVERLPSSFEDVTCEHIEQLAEFLQETNRESQTAWQLYSALRKRDEDKKNLKTLRS